MKRYEKIVLEAKEGINFKVSEGTSGEVIVKALNLVSDSIYSEELPTVLAGEYAEALSVYTDNNGNKAIVPQGWTVSGVDKENTIWGKDKSLVIYKIPSSINWQNSDEVEFLKETYNQFVWIPVEFLSANGTLDGELFSEKFGRRNYMNDEFSDDEFNEALNGELLEQLESVKKYGGFYFSRYNISKSSAGKPQSVKGVMPWVNINFDDTKKIASTIEDNEAVKSHLTFGAEYDSVLEWLIKTEVRTLAEIAKNSTGGGNHRNTENSPRKLVETGSEEGWHDNNIYGYVYEWTQEQSESSSRVIRGSIYDFGKRYPVAYRNYYFPNNVFDKTGFRAALYIK
mgnify:CR=1 FL=1